MNSENFRDTRNYTKMVDIEKKKFREAGCKKTKGNARLISEVIILLTTATVKCKPSPAQT